MPGDDIELDTGCARQPLRGEQAGRGGADVPLLGGDGCEGARVPVLEPVRKMVPPELQQRGGDLLQQHREGPADPDQRPECDSQPGVHRRCGRRADWSPDWSGARRREILPCACPPQRDPRAHRGTPGGVPRHEEDSRGPGCG